MSLLRAIAICLLLLGLPPAADAKPESQLTPAQVRGEVRRLTAELERHTQRTTWAGVDRSYAALLALEVDSGAQLGVPVHLMAAHAARSQGDMNHVYLRLQRAKKVDPMHEEVLTSIAMIEANYGMVDITLSSGFKEGPVTLEALDLGFTPEPRRTVAAAQALLSQARSYRGLLPNSRYVLGRTEFDVVGRPTPVRIFAKPSKKAPVPKAPPEATPVPTPPPERVLLILSVRGEGYTVGALDGLLNVVLGDTRARPGVQTADAYGLPAEWTAIQLGKLKTGLDAATIASTLTEALGIESSRAAIGEQVVLLPTDAVADPAALGAVVLPALSGDVPLSRAADVGPATPAQRQAAKLPGDDDDTRARRRIEIVLSPDDPEVRKAILRDARVLPGAGVLGLRLEEPEAP